MKEQECRQAEYEKRISIKKILTSIVGIVIVGTIIVCLSSCGGKLNTVADPNFTEEGMLVKSKKGDTSFRTKQPSKVTFYVEVSGSMNGFFRPNLATEFKSDLYAILTYYKPIISDVVVLTNDGTQGARFSIDDFQRRMNAGDFVSASETIVTKMLGTILSNLEPKEGEVAVLVSDMKYSPEKDPTKDALMSQYSSDISKVVAPSEVAVSLLAATSNYLDKSGQSIENESPYYYLVMGAPETAGYMRTGIATLLEDANHYVDGFETGYNYKSVRYTFGSTKQALQLDEQPTFYGWDPSSDDTCSINLKLDLSDFRWLTANTEALKKAISVKALYGSTVEVGKISVVCENKRERQINRHAEATIELRITGIPTDSDVIEWTFNHPDDLIGGMTRFFGATSEKEYDKSYSIEGFIKGLTYGGHLNTWNKTPNYILISTKE